MLKVAIAGCGKIADAHASQIQRIKGCEIVGVCDREPLMAQQLADRFLIRRYFSDVETLENVVLSAVPNPAITAMMATAMPAAINPYSMAVAPRSSPRKRKKVATGVSPFGAARSRDCAAARLCFY